VSADKPYAVCARCGTGLHWYGVIARYVHTGNTGQYVSADHAPQPIRQR
jgi:hypothetical protein